MKFSIERAALLKAVGQAQSVVEKRNTIPILANILIEAEGDSVRMKATDLDVEVIDLAPAKVERAGGTTVSAQLLHEIVRKLPDGALVSVTEEGGAGRVAIAAGPVPFPAGDAHEGGLPGHGVGGLRLLLHLPCRRSCEGSSTRRASPSRRRRRATT